MIKHIRLFIACIFFGIPVAFIMFPQFFLLDLVLWAMRCSEARRRAVIAWGTVFWGHVEFCVSSWFLDLGAKFDLPKKVDTPVIHISNHQSIYDILTQLEVCWRLGIMNPVWVMKMELGSTPFIGWFARKIGSIFVKRNGDPEDMNRVRTGARRASDEGASVNIYPEGTRRKGAVAGARRKHVGDLKYGAFCTMQKLMLDYGLVTTMFRFHPALPEGGGRYLSQLTVLVGKMLYVKSWVTLAEVVAREENLLDHEFDRIDAELDKPL